MSTYSLLTISLLDHDNKRPLKVMDKLIDIVGMVPTPVSESTSIASRDTGVDYSTRREVDPDIDDHITL